MSRDEQMTVLQGSCDDVVLRRMANGFPHIRADEEADRYYGLGYAHGRDRQMQMWLMKLIGQGRASECLRSEDLLIQLDRSMRWLGLARDAAEEVAYLSPRVERVLEAYCSGVNAGGAATGRPFEFALVGYRPETWVPADSLLIARMIGFVGMTQSQGDAEKLIVQMLQNGVEPEKL